MHATLTPVLELNARGFFSSDGQFLIDVSGSLSLGSGGFGLFGNAGLTISYLNTPNPYGYFTKQLYVHGRVNASIKAFDVSLIGVGLDVEYNSGSGEFGVTVEVIVAVVPIRVHFTLGHVKTPPQPNFARVENGALILNVGDDANRRGIDAVQRDESYVISQNGDELRVFAFGLSESYSIQRSGITSIAGNFGDGTDSLDIQSTVTLPTKLTLQSPAQVTFQVPAGWRVATGRRRCQAWPAC